MHLGVASDLRCWRRADRRQLSRLRVRRAQWVLPPLERLWGTRDWDLGAYQTWGTIDRPTHVWAANARC